MDYRPTDAGCGYRIQHIPNAASPGNPLEAKGTAARSVLLSQLATDRRTRSIWLPPL